MNSIANELRALVVKWRSLKVGNDSDGAAGFVNGCRDCAGELSALADSLGTSATSGEPDALALLDAVWREVARATVKFPTWPTDPLHAVAVLGEEFGELIKAVLQLTYEPHKTSAEDVREEAIQTAAMAVRFLQSLDVYEYKRGEQHAQTATGSSRPSQSCTLDHPKDWPCAICNPSQSTTKEGWQPIENPPQQMARVLVHHPSLGVCVGTYIPQHNEASRWSFQRPDGSWSTLGGVVTQWIEIPVPPESPN